MPRQTTTTNSKTRRREGFSAIELLITATVLTIVTAFGFIGITKARAAVRLSGAAREYASYVEKARIFSIRRHADTAAQRASVVINADRTSYDVTMDLDGDGSTDTRTVTLPSGITFETVESIAFDWRGRTLSSVAGVTTPNAQVSIRLRSSDDSVSIDVTGSGDITIDSQVFDDSVPNVTLQVGDLAAGATPIPTPFLLATPAPDATPLPIATPDVSVSPMPTPLPIDGLPVESPTPLPDATPTPTPSPTPGPGATPTPTPIPSVCTISTDLESVVLQQDGTAVVRVSHDSSSSLSITASSSKPADLQVTPGGAQTIGAGSATTFTIKSKRSLGGYYVTFSSGCGQKILPVEIAP